MSELTSDLFSDLQEQSPWVAFEVSTRRRTQGCTTKVKPPGCPTWAAEAWQGAVAEHDGRLGGGRDVLENGGVVGVQAPLKVTHRQQQALHGGAAHGAEGVEAR